MCVCVCVCVCVCLVCVLCEGGMAGVVDKRRDPKGYRLACKVSALEACQDCVKNGFLMKRVRRSRSLSHTHTHFPAGNLDALLTSVRGPLPLCMCVCVPWYKYSCVSVCVCVCAG